MSRTPAARRTTAAVEGRKADSARHRQRVIKALNQASSDGAGISVAGIARAAAVDRSFPCRHRDLLEQLHASEIPPPKTAGPGRQSTAPPCTPICSPPTNALPARPPASTNSRNASPSCSASTPGASRGSARPTTSTRSSNASPTSNSRPPTCACSWTNAATT
ncbi:hypothetical protein ACQEVC_12985 [Plantactinospora sp. CA-294935]|uniref:hypothetical protein n=1 Tax=Plantactinospora sp. CA-294935 TaxID=3240012 RepID=UPI003D900251